MRDSRRSLLNVDAEFSLGRVDKSTYILVVIIMRIKGFCKFRLIEDVYRCMLNVDAKFSLGMVDKSLYS